MHALVDVFKDYRVQVIEGFDGVFGVELFWVICVQPREEERPVVFLFSVDENLSLLFFVLARDHDCSKVLVAAVIRRREDRDEGWLLLIATPHVQLVAHVFLLVSAN